MANRNSSDSTQRELSNAYQHDRVKKIHHNDLLFYAFNEKNSAAKGLTLPMLSLLPSKAHGEKDI